MLIKSCTYSFQRIATLDSNTRFHTEPLESAMPQTPELPQPAYPDLDSMLSRKFGREVANYFAGTYTCLWLQSTTNTHPQARPSTASPFSVPSTNSSPRPSNTRRPPSSSSGTSPHSFTAPPKYTTPRSPTSSPSSAPTRTPNPKTSSSPPTTPPSPPRSCSSSGSTKPNPTPASRTASTRARPSSRST